MYVCLLENIFKVVGPCMLYPMITVYNYKGLKRLLSSHQSFRLSVWKTRDVPFINCII